MENWISSSGHPFPHTAYVKMTWVKFYLLNRKNHALTSECFRRFGHSEGCSLDYHIERPFPAGQLRKSVANNTGV